MIKRYIFFYATSHEKLNKFYSENRMCDTARPWNRPLDHVAIAWKSHRADAPFQCSAILLLFLSLQFLAFVFCLIKMSHRKLKKWRSLANFMDEKERKEWRKFNFILFARHVSPALVKRNTGLERWQADERGRRWVQIEMNGSQEGQMYERTRDNRRGQQWIKRRKRQLPG